MYLKIIGVLVVALTSLFFLQKGLNKKLGDEVLTSVKTEKQLELTNKEENTQSKQVASENEINLSVNGSRSIYFAAVVTEESVSQAIDVVQALDQTSGPIVLFISSPGGSVLAGNKLISVMEYTKNPVYTVCVDLCASMAAIIHQYGHKRLAYKRALLMFHDASGSAQGEVKKMLSMLNTIEKGLDKADTYIANKSNMSKEAFEKLTAHDLWIDAEDALKLNLVDGVIKVVPQQRAAARISSGFGDLKRDKKSTGSEVNSVKVVPMTIGITVEDAN